MGTSSKSKKVDRGLQFWGGIPKPALPNEGGQINNRSTSHLWISNGRYSWLVQYLPENYKVISFQFFESKLQKGRLKKVEPEEAQLIISKLLKQVGELEKGIAKLLK